MDIIQKLAFQTDLSSVKYPSYCRYCFDYWLLLLCTGEVVLYHATWRRLRTIAAAGQ